MDTSTEVPRTGRQARLWIGLIGFLLAPLASAQVLDEIVVTAQKREQNAQDVGIAVTAFSGEQLQSLGFRDSLDITRLTSGLHVAVNSGGQFGILTIRGVTQNDFNDAVEGPVAVYVDEGYLAMLQGQTFALFDVDRVEVLKGPQGTLFGRNATGGLIHYVTRRPTTEASGYADVTYGSHDQVRFEGALSGPLTDTIGGRLSVLYNRHDALLKNQYPRDATVAGTPGGGQDIWNEDVWAARGQLAFAFGERADLLVSGFYSRQTVSESPWQSEPALAVFDAQGRVVNTLRAGPGETREAVGPGGVGVDIPAIDGDFDGLRPRAGGDLYGYRDPDGGGPLISKDAAFDDSNVYETRGATARLTWDVGDDRTLTAVSHAVRFDKTILNDVDAGPMPLSLYQAVARTDSFTQEVRLDGRSERTRWVAGLYVLDIAADTSNGLSFPANSPFASPLIFGAPVEGNNVVALDTRSYSVFGQIDRTLAERWTLTAGARAIREEKQYDWSQNFYLNTDDRALETATLLFPGAASTDGPTLARETNDTLWSGKVQIEYRPADDVLLYGSVNRGVKAGSFNAKLPDGSPPLVPADVGYGEEVLLAYEVGAKSTLADGALRLNGAVFYYDYSDYQAFVFTQSSGTVTNADASSFGGEIDVLATPMAGLDLLLSASYIDATVEDLEVAPGLFRDVRPSYTPKVKLAGLVRYEWPLLGGRLSAQLDANYVSSFYYNIRNFDAQRVGNYTIGNARLMWRSPRDSWNVSAYVENFADRRYQTGGFDLASLCGCNEVSFGKPRWYGLTARYKF